MNHCQVSFEELNLFVDGELEAAAELDMRRHLDVCVQCTARVAGLTRLKTAVGGSVSAEPAPPALSHVIRSYAGEGRPRRLRWVAMAAAAVALATTAVATLIVLVSSSRMSSSADSFTTALVADHIHYAHHPERLEVAESDPVALSRWFASRLPFEPHLPRFHDARVVGGRLCALKGNRFALAFLDRGGAPVSVFVGAADALTPEAQRSWAGTGSRRDCQDAIRGYRVCYERRGSQVTAIVGPDRLPPPA